jgi:hypothetical protein
MTGERRTGCLVCGKELQYLPEQKPATCYYCRQQRTTDILCRDGHFVCDRCHRATAEEIIGKYCGATTELDPVAIARTLMDTPQVTMHGPEHHFLVPAALLAAYYNVRGKPDEKVRTVAQAQQRASLIKDKFCSTHGDCGAAVGTGIFISLVTGATPLSQEEWRLSNLMTAKSLETIALHGGPRCCKRNTFLAIQSAASFTKEHFGIVMPVTKPVRCTFSDTIRECVTRDCPFYG